jgi:hypothetical protein
MKFIIISCIGDVIVSLDKRQRYRFELTRLTGAILGTKHSRR